MLSFNTGAIVPKQGKSKSQFLSLERGGGLHGASSVLFHCSQPLRKMERVSRVAIQSCAKNYNIHSFKC